MTARIVVGALPMSIEPSTRPPRVLVRMPLVLPGQRVGVMGGSFNPPHEGHLVVAETAMKRLGLDQMWWLVTPGNPQKSHGGLPPLEQRLELCRRLARHPRMHVTGFEAALGTAYTADTLAFLAARHPDVHWVWVMGADNLASFDSWRHWRQIASLMPLAVVDRPGFRLKAASCKAAQTFRRGRLDEAKAGGLWRRRPPAWTLLSTRLSRASSTELRAGAIKMSPLKSPHLDR